MNNIVWVFGNSASGKETFINALIEGKAEKVITDLNLSGNKIVKINSSIKYIGQYENDPITKNRVLIITEAEEQLKNKDTTVLISGRMLMRFSNFLKSCFINIRSPGM